MNEPGGLDRRSFFKRGGVAVAGAAAGSAALAPAATGGATAGDGAARASSLATVVRPQGGDSLLVRRIAGSRSLDVADSSGLELSHGPAVHEQPDGSTTVVTDGVGDERWEAGQEVVLLEELIAGSWTVTAVQRMYRRIDGQDGDDLRVTRESRERGEGQRSTRPLDRIPENASVLGIGFLTSSDDCSLTVAQADVEP